MRGRGAALEMDWHGTYWPVGAGYSWVVANDGEMTSLIYDIVPGYPTRDLVAHLTDASVSSDAGILGIGAIGGSAGVPCIDPTAASRSCWRVATG